MKNHINEKEAITNLQRYLRQLSHEDNDYLTVPIDGIFDTATHDALLEFQRRNKLEPTGVVDAKTWDILYSEYRKSLLKNAVPLNMPLFPRVPQNYEIKIGDTGPAVTALEFMLNELSIIYDGFEKVDESGKYNDATQSAVKEFQRRNSLAESGRVDRNTWNEIVTQYEKNSYGYQR